MLSSLYDGKPVAVKEMHIQENMITGILSELKIISGLDDRGIIKNYGYSRRKDKDGEYFILVMEKADGDLSDLIGKLSKDGHLKKPCSMKKKKLYILQIAHGLYILNQHNLYHGDLKLDNVLVVRSENGEYNCKLSDFGMSKFIPDGWYEIDDWCIDREDLARTFTFGNLAQYYIFILLIHSRAPELYKLDYKEDIDPKKKQEMLLKSDVFALGVLISEIITGLIETKVYKNNDSKVLSVYNVGIWNSFLT